MKTVILYGSTSGNTRAAAERIQRELGGRLLNVAEAKEADLAEAELLVLGTSTWGIGKLQDDWLAFLDVLRGADLSGKKVALFGMGGQYGYDSTYVDGMGELYEVVCAGGAEVIGATSKTGYHHRKSRAEVDGRFVGLALDDDHQAELTGSRISNWVVQLKKAL